jgi:hypothetical protein
LFVKETSYFHKVKCYIKENSFIAKLAAKKLCAFSVAIVIGKTIHLHNSSKQQFINNSRWLKHELVHIKQFQQHGYLPFIIKYLWESIRKGYTNNKYEVEARAGENNTSICQDVTILI